MSKAYQTLALNDLNALTLDELVGLLIGPELIGVRVLSNYKLNRADRQTLDRAESLYVLYRENPLLKLVRMERHQLSSGERTQKLVPLQIGELNDLS